MTHQDAETDATPLLEWLDAVADRFEAAWKGPTPPDLGEFLGQTVGAVRRALAAELAAIDLAYRRRTPNPRSWDDYRRTYPELDGHPPEGDLAASPTLPSLPGATATSLPPLQVPGYEILDRLGQGGMGVVYRARQLGLNRLVALKLLRAEAGPREAARLRAEAEAAASLQHPNLVAIYEVGEHLGQPFFSMELVEGGPLSARLAQGPLSARQAAELVETLARAIHYAHERGLVHRDLKPANVLLAGTEPNPPAPFPKREGGDQAGAVATTSRTSPSGSPPFPLREGGLGGLGFSSIKISDFGLAKHLNAPQGLSRTGDLLGTPEYMAPEQARGDVRAVGRAADVYALGAILYECVTGRPPFRGTSLLSLLDRISREEPATTGGPRDLETIARKCLEKEPARRYASALALADDLRRYLDGRPIQARPVGRLERGWRWCRRNPVVATLVALVALLLVGTTAEALRAAAHATAAAAADHRAAAESRREALLRQLQLLRSQRQASGWSAQAWKLVAEAAAVRRDAALRDEAAAVLAGLDLEEQIRWPGSASHVAFDAAGKRLLMGGADNPLGQPEGPGRLWDGQTVTPDPRPGGGPVTFGPDGRAWRLFLNPGRPVVLAPAPGQGTPVKLDTTALPAAAQWEGCALAADAAYVAGSGTAHGQPWVAVWSGATGQLLWQAEAEGTLAIGGRWLAAGDAAGQVRVWELATGKARGQFRADRTAVHALAFDAAGGRLATGHGGGRVAIWDWRAGRPLAYCHGAVYDVYALAFSPDGSWLASGGRGPVRLWDTATGRPLLEHHAGDYVGSLAFSPDGGRLAVASQNRGVGVWAVRRGRGGLRVLHGLNAPIAHLLFSPDGRQVAAFAHDWQAAIWDLESGQRRHLLAVPRGMLADNAGLAFSPDGRRFAVATGAAARLWDLTGDGPPRDWPLPPGLGDQLRFTGPERLWLFRIETRDGKVGPITSADPEVHPRVGRVRNLLGPEPLRPLWEVTAFPEHIFYAAVPPDARLAVVEGIRAEADGPKKMIRAFDGADGHELWALPATNPLGCPANCWFVSGRALALVQDNEPPRTLDPHTRATQTVFNPPPSAVSPDGRWLTASPPPARTRWGPGCTLYRHGDPEPVVVLGLGVEPTPARPQFSPDGRRLAWGTNEGLVFVADLEALNAELATVGLGW